MTGCCRFVTYIVTDTNSGCLTPRLHQDTCRPETCIPDEQLLSGYLSALGVRLSRRHATLYKSTFIFTYMSTDTCRRIQVARPGYLWTVSRRHNYCSYMSRSTCVPLYPATDGRQTGDSFVADTRNMLTATSGGYNLYRATCILV